MCFMVKYHIINREEILALGGTVMKKILLGILLVLMYCSQSVLVYADESENIRNNYVRAYFVSLAAASCLGVYSPDNSSEFSYLRDYGWQIVPYREVNEGVESNFAVAHNYFKDVDKEIYLVTFRGSVTKKDWDIDLNTGQVPYGGDTLLSMRRYAEGSAEENAPAVHKGFNLYVDSVLKAAAVDENNNLKSVFKEAAENKNAFLIITGHSLGGATATLLGERLASLGMPKEKFAVITFGAPAIGNKAFAEKYGDKINLLRVTNEADPIPGSMQTFFSGYKQFGEHYKYDLSTKVSNIQHAMALYFDHSVNEYFNAAIAAAKAGLIKLRPDKNIEEGKPLVAVWVKEGKGLSDNQYIPDLKGFITGCYKNSLPSYVIMDQSLTELPQDELLRLSRETGAKYMLVCNIDRQKIPNEEYAYIVLGQGLSDANGKMITMGSFAKKIVPESGYIQATGENFLQARDALGEQIPVITQYRELPLLPVNNEGAVF